MKIHYALIFLMLSCTSSQISSSLQKTTSDLLGSGEPTEEEVGSGLKEALIKGITEGSERASAVDGYFKNPKIRIPFPPDVQQVETKLRQIGLDQQVDNFILTLNRGAEEAAKEAKPIFVAAIKQLTIQDAWNILRGEKDEATQFLQRTTSGELRSKFQPVIKRSLDAVNATKYYSDLVTTYNKIPLVQKVNPDLDEYATDKAMEGLFTLIAEEEANIRENPVARTTELLKKVFGQLD